MSTKIEKQNQSMSNVASLLNNHRIACITTTSIKEILKLFAREEGKEPKYNITRLKARASNITKGEPAIDDKKYGIEAFKDMNIDTFTINYTLGFDDDGREMNPLDRKVANEIINGMNQFGIRDASVEFMQVLIKDSEIGRLSNTNEEIFHVYFDSEPCESDAEIAFVKESSVNEELIKHNRFKYRLLNVKKVIDRRQELTLSASEWSPQIQWRGTTAIHLRSPIKLAQRLREHFGDFRAIKTYVPSNEDVLVLVNISR